MAPRTTGSPRRGVSLSRRRRRSSNAATAPALATFSDSTPPSIGIASSPSHSSRTAGESPSVSLPSTSATRRGSSASSSDSPAACSPSTVNPPSRSAAQPSSAVAARSTGARNATPAEALTTSGSIAGAPRRGSSTPSRPAAVALRSTMPTLAGLVTPVEHQHGRRVVAEVQEELVDRLHPRRDDVGEHALVVPPVAGQHLDPVRRRPLHRHPAGPGRGEDGADRLATRVVGQHDLVDVQLGVVQRLLHGLAPVHGDEGVLG